MTVSSHRDQDGHDEPANHLTQQEDRTMGWFRSRLIRGVIGLGVAVVILAILGTVGVLRPFVRVMNEISLLSSDAAEAPVQRGAGDGVPLRR